MSERYFLDAIIWLSADNHALNAARLADLDALRSSEDQLRPLTTLCRLVFCL